MKASTLSTGTSNTAPVPSFSKLTRRTLSTRFSGKTRRNAVHTYALRSILLLKFDPVKSSVTLSACAVRRLRFVTVVCPAMAASACARTSVSVRPSALFSMRPAAASRNSRLASTGTVLTFSAAPSAAASASSFAVGVPIRSSFTPARLSILSMRYDLFCPNSVTEVPDVLARPVRPERWMYVSKSFGGSICTTSSQCQVLAQPRRWRRGS